jgi:hypothetical protein
MREAEAANLLSLKLRVRRQDVDELGLRRANMPTFS